MYKKPQELGLGLFLMKLVIIKFCITGTILHINTGIYSLTLK